MTRLRPGYGGQATDWDELHDVKGLAATLKRSREYVVDMKACGFVMPGGRATLRMAVKCAISFTLRMSLKCACF